MQLKSSFLLLFLILIFNFMDGCLAFIVGGCIGPKSVLERLLSPAEKMELRRIVHTSFDGTNASELLSRVNQYVLSKIGPHRWNQILPELISYQSKGHECSIYAQLLPRQVYKNLLTSVWRASESGASKDDLKRLVEDYVDRALAAGVIPSTVLQPKPIQNTLLPKPKSIQNSVLQPKPIGSTVLQMKHIGSAVIQSKPRTLSSHPVPFNYRSVISPVAHVNPSEEQVQPLFPLFRPE